METRNSDGHVEGVNIGTGNPENGALEDTCLYETD